jgi:hypothetical protein
MLYLDDMAARHEAVIDRLSEWDVTHVYDARACMRALESQERFDLVSLDHDLEDEHYSYGYTEGALARTGWDVVVFMRSIPEERRPKYVNVHSANPPAAERMVNELRAHGYQVSRYNTMDLLEVLKNA